MTNKRILVGVAALALAAAVTIPAAGAASSRSNAGPSFVDMNDDGAYSKKVDIAIERLGGGIKQQDGGKIVTGSAIGTTFLMVANGHDLYLNRNVSGSNLVIANRGGDIHVAPGVEISSSGQGFGLATRDRSGDKSEGALILGEGASVQHTYSGRTNRQVQIEAADLTVGKNVDIASTSGAKKASRTASSQSANAYVRATRSLSIDGSASIEGLQVIGPNS
jgi:hypothetical protein